MNIVQICPTESQVEDYLRKNRNHMLIHCQENKGNAVFISYLEEEKPKGGKGKTKGQKKHEGLIRHIRCENNDYICVADKMIQHNLYDGNRVLVTSPIHNSLSVNSFQGCPFSSLDRQGLCHTAVPGNRSGTFRFCGRTCGSDRSCCSAHSNCSPTLYKNGVLRPPLTHCSQDAAIQFMNWYNTITDAKKASAVTYFDPLEGGTWRVLGASSAAVASGGSSGGTGKARASAAPFPDALAGGSYVVYTQKGCGHCDSAIGCLRRNQCRFRTVEATAALAKKYGIETTPHIMFEDEVTGREHFVGGYTELEQLMRTMHFMNTTVMWQRVSKFHEVYNEHRHSPWTFCGSKICCRNTKSNMAQIEFLLRRKMIAKSDLNIIGSNSAANGGGGTIEIDTDSLLRAVDDVD